MLFLTFSTLLTSSLLPVISAKSTKGTLHLDLIRNDITQHGPRAIHPRDPMDSSITYVPPNQEYLINITVGTPPQKVRVVLDTGSATLWVNSASNPICNANACTGGSFDNSTSSTFNVTEIGGFSAFYGSAASESGDWITETVSIEGASMPELQIGLSTNSNGGTVGTMGVGYTTTGYPNVPFAMAASGAISTPAYSLWMNDRANGTGSILFGGIDTAKYSGDLISFPITPQSNGILSQLMINVTSLSAGTKKLTEPSFNYSMILDSGTNGLGLPKAAALAVLKQISAVNSTEHGWAAPCSMAEAPGGITVEFGGVANITVPYSQWLSTPIKSYTISGEQACDLRFSISNGKAPYVMGQTFLGSAYVVYDLANKRIAVAQTNFNTTDSNVIAFPSMNATIPSATSSESLSVTTVSSSTSLLNSNIATTTPPVVVTANPTATSSSSPVHSISAGATFAIQRAMLSKMAAIGLVAYLI